MEIVRLLIFSLSGFIFGSFFVVVGLRLPQQQPFTTERSCCPNCCIRLSWFELIPVLSYAFLKRSCRHCKNKISSIYPIIEILTAAMFTISYSIIGWNPELVVALLVSSLLIICLVSDIFYMVIPNQLLLFFLPVFMLLRVLEPLDPWWDTFQGGLVGLLIPLLVVIVSHGGMGMGDVKLFGLLGIVLGTTNLVLSFVLASIIGSIIGLVLLAYNQISLGKPTPFAPYIVIGTWIAYFYGDAMIHWYMTRFFTLH
ncbi:prepilin peptidase [Virgibacillus dokdonensis]|uniref:Type 4 prepilin-like protein leader peptide-processing enzyme n=1 Tax=Virgibacillus dokdonensis TaxID=302167 RepID=A0A2K9J4M4_9BACI|nr:A24 family peptidase [Virgibacillus dokdonensis]AUJ25993.1 Type 4 prepilin-like protein leader peptide-processing enzyme [Virgibacillus dokdonensis]